MSLILNEKARIDVLHPSDDEMQPESQILETRQKIVVSALERVCFSTRCPRKSDLTKGNREISQSQKTGMNGSIALRVILSILVYYLDNRHAIWPNRLSESTRHPETTGALALRAEISSHSTFSRTPHQLAPINDQAHVRRLQGIRSRGGRLGVTQAGDARITRAG